MVITSPTRLASLCFERETNPSRDVTSTVYDDFGCRLNEISIDQLFTRYRQIGFLYPEKLRRLEPFLPEIKDQWQRAARAGDLLHRIITYEREDIDAWASMSVWRTTRLGWSGQHLVSTGNPIASRAVMLAEKKRAIHEPNHMCTQNWFRPTNRLPKKIFGSVVGALGTDNAWMKTFDYVAVTPRRVNSRPTEFSIVPCDHKSQAQLYEFARMTRGPVYAKAEALDDPDFGLSVLNAMYRQVGLQRYRRAWLAISRKSGDVLGAIIVYRGPLGLNFSFLENRSDLLISDAVRDTDLSRISDHLIAAATETYDDFLPGFIPVICDDRAAHALAMRGDQVLRQYCQSIWRRPVYDGWYRHIDRFYERIVRRFERQRTPV